jgi:hypothetical protein
MKYIIIALAFITSAQAKDAINYSCKVNSSIHIELSLIDKNMPSVGLFYKKNKFAQCFYETTPDSSVKNSRAQVQQSIWSLALKKCDYYSDKHPEIVVMNDVTFKQAAGKSGSYFRVLKDTQPLFCLPLK